MTVMSEIDTMVERGLPPADGGRVLPVDAQPTRGVVVVTCMDTRVNPYEIFALHTGEVHLIRNAGGVVTEDVIRSIAISQQFLGTTEVLLLRHTDCRMQGLDDAALAERVPGAPPLPTGGFTDAEQDLRASLDRIAASPHLLNTVELRGFVYDVASGRLSELRR